MTTDRKLGAPRLQKTSYGVIAVASLAAFAGLPSTDVVARDRPGTPSLAATWVCDPRAGSLSVCTMFSNTATERVFFEAELTVNGITPAERPKAICLGRVPPPKCNLQDKFACPRELERQQAPKTACHAARSFNGRSPGDEVEGRTTRNGEERPWLKPILGEGVQLTQLEHDTEYCFRFRARRTEDGVVSEKWSNWACATTPPAHIAPKKPGPPSGVTLDYYDTGREPIPYSAAYAYATMIVAWKSGRDAAFHRVEVKSAGNNFLRIAEVRSGERLRVVDKLDFFRKRSYEQFELVYRICAVNESGEACINKTIFAAQSNVGRVQDTTHANSDILAKPKEPAPRTLPTHADDMMEVPDAIKVLVKPGKFGSKVMAR